MVVVEEEATVAGRLLRRGGERKRKKSLKKLFFSFRSFSLRAFCNTSPLIRCDSAQNGSTQPTRRGRGGAALFLLFSASEKRRGGRVDFFLEDLIFPFLFKAPSRKTQLTTTRASFVRQTPSSLPSQTRTPFPCSFANQAPPEHRSFCPLPSPRTRAGNRNGWRRRRRRRRRDKERRRRPRRRNGSNSRLGLAAPEGAGGLSLGRASQFDRRDAS